MAPSRAGVEEEHRGTAHAGSGRPRLGGGSRMHGDVRRLRADRPVRGHRHRPRRARRRDHPARHRRLLRHGAQRAPHRRGAARPGPRPGGPVGEVRGPARPRRRLPGIRRPAGGGQELPRLQPATAGDRPRRHLPAGPPRPGRPHRGDRRGRVRVHRRRLGAPSGAVRGRGRHRPPGPCRPPGGRRPARVLADVPEPRVERPPDHPGPGHRRHRLRRALAGPAVGQVVARSSAGTERLPGARPALRAGERGREPGPGRCPRARRRRPRC